MVSPGDNARAARCSSHPQQSRCLSRASGVRCLAASPRREVLAAVWGISLRAEDAEAGPLAIHSQSMTPMELSQKWRSSERKQSIVA